ncbi:MAG: DUF721 domain-containing protein [Rickettsiaceae bacterium]|jgi:hypothetical protein|nr:DUF721 domain-containing protein [Alphaproteobacteria bacterium]MCP5362526.1 DUF721 domain-containing protein [Rickettsiaceae bacterium]MCP5375281.1 DUF721 domain-containing protein [Rickettsiaceae bacterium]MCP5378048.1 DUF721 domain-containing protein [Rickettsiaceae bacterium]
MKPIIENVNKIIYKIYKNKNPVLADIIINWPKIVGVKYSQNTLPLKINTLRDKNKKINILMVEVSNAATSVEIAFQQDIIIERLAVYMGYKAINKIRTIVKI